MAAVNSKARQPKYKTHSPMHRDERHGLDININSVYPKRKGAAAAVGMPRHGLNRKFMAAVNTNARQPKIDVTAQCKKMKARLEHQY